MPATTRPSRLGGRAAREGQSGWKAAIRRTPGGGLLLKGGTLVVGGAFMALGAALVVLPGPLTIPPVLLGLYILAGEFDWADRLLLRAQRSAQEAWAQARRRPVISAVTTVGGLVAAGVLIWAIGHYSLIDRGREVLGL